MRRIIGVDFGDCEIAAAISVFENGKFVRMDDLYLDGDRNKVIPNEVTYGGELFNYYKASPGHFDEEIRGDQVIVTRRKLLEVKFAEIIKAIKARNSSINNGDQILLLVGCPTSGEWTSEKNRKEYEKLIKRATGVDEVRVVPESRAAMFSALADGKGRMISAAEGAVVYDFGSSTADGTYMKTGERCLEFSWKLGAREVEKELRKLMCRKAVQEAYAKGLDLEPVENYAKLERRLRKAKEAYFNGELDEETSAVTYKFKTVQGEDLKVLLDIDKATMEEALGNDISLKVNGESIPGGWKKCCEEFLRRSKANIEKNHRSVKEIVLTGGASKMDFVQALARKVFPENSYTVTCAKNPSFSVSQGLVWVGLVDEMENDIVSIVTKKVKYEKSAFYGHSFRHSRLSNLKHSINTYMTEKIYQAVLSAATDWAEASTKESLNSFENRIKRAIDGQQESISCEIRRSVENWSNSISLEICTQLEAEIQKNFGSALCQKMRIPESKWKSVRQSLNGINLDSDKIISGINVSWLMKVLKGFIYGLLAFPFGGEFGSSLIMEATIDSKKEVNKGAKRSQAVRWGIEMLIRKRNESIKEMCSEQIDKIIDSQMTDDSLAKDIEAIIRRAYEIMTLKFEVK